MNILVNGTKTPVTEPCTIARLLQQYELGDSPCAVEVNTDLVPKAHHETHELKQDDEVEIVTLVGGG